MKKSLRQSTICIRGGWKPKNGEPVQPPIIQSTTFKYDNSEEMSNAMFWHEEIYGIVKKAQKASCGNQITSYFLGSYIRKVYICNQKNNIMLV